MLLPGQLQATFDPNPDYPEHSSLIWWGVEDPGAAARKFGLPEGLPGTHRIALSDGNNVTTNSVPVRAVRVAQAVSALAQAKLGKTPSDSLRAWQAAATIALDTPDPQARQRLAEVMPAAAYALCRADGTLWAPDELLEHFVYAVDRAFRATDHAAKTLARVQEVDAKAPISVDATLRPYQRRGIAWLRAIAAHQRGGLLADDMGLGKTLQAIALLADRDGNRPHLVVCPTSVVGNWAREIKRFAPDVAVLRHHGPDRRDHTRFPPGTVVITSYQLLLRDVSLLSQVNWDVVVLDEAQQIKNHNSQTAAAARRLPGQVRVALTGTPVENRLSELWSIMDYANPGLLGPHNRFHKRFAEAIENRQDKRATERLRQIVRPYLLRRLKEEVAADLPEKQESVVACSLTPEQAKLYSAAIERSYDDGFGSGIERHGRILRLLTQLKQICNHPAQYLGQTEPITGRSGKLARATEMLTEAVDEGTQSLVFTQYRAMGELLSRHLSESLDLPRVPFLHGGLARTARDSIVEDFQAGDFPILVVSLKAGGTGLNLTAATHVLHYDRWWNPAVEDQATDRAHRIGQDRPVTVYKLVTGGTLEDRISTLLERKRGLAESIVGTGEDWLTKMDDAELRELIALSETEVAE